MSDLIWAARNLVDAMQTVYKGFSLPGEIDAVIDALAALPADFGKTHVLLPKQILIDAIRGSDEVRRVISLMNGVRLVPDSAIAELLREAATPAARGRGMNAKLELALQGYAGLKRCDVSAETVAALARAVLAYRDALKLIEHNAIYDMEGAGMPEFANYEQTAGECSKVMKTTTADLALALGVGINE